MRAGRNRMKPVLASGVLILIGVVCSPTQAAPPSQAAWIDRVRASGEQAKANFTTPTDAELSAAARSAATGVRALRTALDTIPTGGEAVRQLDLSRLTDSLGAGSVAASDVTRWANGFGTTPQGVAETVYDQARGAVTRWARLLAMRADSDCQVHFGAAVDALVAACAAYESTRDDNHFRGLAAAYDDLSRYPSTADLRRIVRQEVSRPNQVIRVASQFVVGAIDRDIRAPLDINEQSNGSTVRGSGTIVGRLSSSLPPSQTRGQSRLEFRGTGDTNMTIQQRRATVQARGHLILSGSILLMMTNDGLRRGEVIKSITSHTRPAGAHVARKIFPRLLSRIVLRVAAKKMPQEDPGIAKKAGDKLEQIMQAEVDPLIAKANQWIDRLYWQPLNRRAIDPAVTLSTTPTHIEWIARYTQDEELGAPSNAPAFVGPPPAIGVQFHESAVRNCASILASRAFSQPDFHELIYGTLGLVTDESKSAARGQIPVAITLAERRPIAARFENGRAIFTLRIASFEFDGREYRVGSASPSDDGALDPAWTASVSYDVRAVGGHIELSRAGDVAVDASGDELALLSDEVLPRLFTKHATTVTKEESSGGDLVLSHFTFGDGWLSVGMSPRQ